MKNIMVSLLIVVPSVAGICLAADNTTTGAASATSQTLPNSPASSKSINTAYDNTDTANPNYNASVNAND